LAVRTYPAVQYRPGRGSRDNRPVPTQQILGLQRQEPCGEEPKRGIVMVEGSTHTHIRASANDALVSSRVAATDNVRVEFLRCRSDAIVQWRVARPEFGLVCARDERNAVTASTGSRNFWFSPEGVDAEGELVAEAATDCIGLFVAPSFIPRTIREELPEPIAGSAQGPIGRAFTALMGEFGETAEPLPIHIEGFAMGASCAGSPGGGSAPALQRPGAVAVAAGEGNPAGGAVGKAPVNVVARACKLSTSHFSRAFKASTGVSPHQWVVTARLASARHLLANSETPLAEVADICGFSDQSHFSRVFGRFHATSPGVWRREHRF
jgi:AraC-like DNA-binding protein